MAYKPKDHPLPKYTNEWSINLTHTLPVLFSNFSDDCIQQLPQFEIVKRINFIRFKCDVFCASDPYIDSSLLRPHAAKYR
jgi:hypothetical protein